MKRLLKFFRAAPESEALEKRLPTILDIEAARERLRHHIHETPLTFSYLLSEELGIEIYLKWDNKLRTGAFKERGALNFLLQMSEAARSKGVCTVSAGNHAQALSLHCMKLGVPCHIVMPTTAALMKVEACRRFDAKVILHGNNFHEGLAYVQRYAIEKNLTYVPAFDHEHIIAGQGVPGLELLDQLEDFDAVILPIGGGGYISGVATAIKSRRPEVFVLGVCSEWAEHSRHGEHLNNKFAPPTIADGIAVKTIGELTGAAISRYVDKIAVVSENAISSALIRFLQAERSVIEGAAAAAVAALLQRELPTDMKRVVLFLSGSNIDINVLSRLIERDIKAQGRVLKIRTEVPDRPGSLHELTGILAKSGANILHVSHERSYAEAPGYVEVMWLLEVRNYEHGEELVGELQRVGLKVEVS